MKKPVIFISFIVVTIIVLSVVQVVVSNSLSTTGIELAKFEDQIATYKKQNEILHEKVLAISSLTYIASRAGEMGFVEDKSRVFLSSPLPIAAKP